ncbi:MAG: D-amino acid dehydrogenase, partial [Gammaproteobacteria bacterium]|nr:D-amino acid dehydrogenase [Gammaproteobacteria bacterium]
WGAASPWAAPGLLRRSITWLLRPNSPIVLRPRIDPDLWRWLVAMLGQCNNARYLINKERQLRLARYSHERLTQLRADIGVHYDAQSRGLLILYRSSRDLEIAVRESRLLTNFGVEHRLLDREGCLAQEPALASARLRIAGGMHFPGDESGDCRRFTEALAQRAQRAGMTTQYSTNVQRLESANGSIARVITDRGTLEADAYVLACGSYSSLLLKPLGIHLPVYPVKGYSITAPIVSDAHAPQGTLTDETYKIVITRLGDRLRAAGTAELGGYDLTLRSERIEMLKRMVNQMFPQAALLERAEPWAGLRPMTPDNAPVLGATPYPNLYLNTGHGTLGWTMACGSGKILADIVSARVPDIDLDGLTLNRFF